MNESLLAVLLMGSPRRTKSTSQALGSYLMDKLRAKGFSTKELRINPCPKTEESRAALMSDLDRADVVALCFPLYFDSLPAPVTETLELIAEHRKSLDVRKSPSLVAISNSGFPEAAHNETALAICKQFAQEAGFKWSGGLALGGGEMIAGRPLAAMGRMVRNVSGSLDMAVDALANGAEVPEHAIRLMGKPIIPGWLYTFMGSLRWLWRARKARALTKLWARPYKAS